MSWPIQDLADAFLTLLRSAAGSPALTVYDGSVPAPVDLPPEGLPPMFALVCSYIETPDGLVAPDAVSLTGDSDVIDARAYVHCIGSNPEAARASRAVAGRVRAAVLNQRLTLPGRDCSPIRWREGSPPQRNEEIPGRVVFDQTDVYGWRSVPG
jgi:hypothetical protein